MKIFLVTLGLVGAALSMPLDVEWAQWKQLHGKTYTDENEHRSRMAWLQNYHYIQKHNSEDHSFKLGLNEYADMVSLLQTENSKNNQYYFPLVS